MGLSLCSKASSPSNMLQAQLSITPLTLELPGTMPISRTCAPTLKHCQSFVPLVMLNGSRRSKWTQGPAQSPTLSGGLTLPFFPQFHIEDIQLPWLCTLTKWILVQNHHHRKRSEAHTTCDVQHMGRITNIPNICRRLFILEYFIVIINSIVNMQVIFTGGV